MTQPRRRIWRLSTVLPAVLTAVAGAAAVAVVSTSPGAPHAANFTNRAPLGDLNQFYQRPGGMRAVGWDFDPDATHTAVVTFSSVDNKYRNGTTSSVVRPDVAKVHPNAGAAHGFNFVIPVPEGKHAVCVAAKNIAKGSNLRLGCITKVFDYGPFGSINAVTAKHGVLSVKGWTVDADKVSAAITTTVTVDGAAHTMVANKSRPDVANVRKGAGPNHGFAASYAVRQGKHTVCISVKNIGYGSNNSLGCRTVTLNDSPRGYLDTVAQQAGKLRVVGWTFDPDAPTTARTVSIKVDNTVHNVTAKASRPDVNRKYAGVGNSHGYDVSYTVPEGRHQVCVTFRNTSFGSDVALPCRTVTIAFTPTAALAPLTATATGLKVGGWATDPDTKSAVSVRLTVDGKTSSTIKADDAGSSHSGHNFAAALTTKSGKHTVCATALNVGYGTHNSAASCRTIALALKPIGRFDSIKRATGSANLALTGWAIDPDTTGAVSIAVTVDGKALPASVPARATRTDVARVYPAYGAAHGLASVLTATSGEHTVCLTALDVGGHTNVSLGCRLIIAVHPTAPSTPRSVTAIAGYGGATVTWTPPALDGGAPPSKYTVVASPSGKTVTVGGTVTSATVSGLAAGTTYKFLVQAFNVVGPSEAVTSAAVRTQTSPPPQKTPAPVSTSRYIRNIRGSSTAELAIMRKEGAADAAANPSGHGYLILLDIGGQDAYDGGVVLSATTRFVTYANLLKDLQAYVDGYHSAQRASAPVTVAVGTNNDMDVTAAAGKAWATQVVNPLAGYAKRYTGITVAGANDIEPGFRAGYTATKSWLTGYLAATTAPFVFNGSADGCAWTIVNRGCNNGWTMAGLYYLAVGAQPVRMLSLPQIYNYTMADQWKYISLTGVTKGSPRINFAGTLTEWTACDQTNSCGSITGRTAWSKLWSNLQSDSRLKVPSLPYATDLRVDR